MKATRTILLSFLAVTCLNASAQNAHPAPFHGAQARLKSYKALFILDESDPHKMHMVLKNIENAMKDPRLAGKLQVELIAFGDGVELYKKTNGLDTLLLPLFNKGVVLAECENTMRMKKLSPKDLWPFVSYVPSGNGEIIIRESQGWVGIHP